MKMYIVVARVYNASGLFVRQYPITKGMSIQNARAIMDMGGLRRNGVEYVLEESNGS